MNGHIDRQIQAYEHRQIMFFECRLIIKGIGFISLSKYTSSCFTMRIHQPIVYIGQHCEKSHEQTTRTHTLTHLLCLYLMFVASHSRNRSSYRSICSTCIKLIENYEMSKQENKQSEQQTATNTTAIATLVVVASGSSNCF